MLKILGFDFFGGADFATKLKGSKTPRITKVCF
jgi:hypothetical protein